MLKQFLTFNFLLLTSLGLLAQTDSTQNLNEVTVKAFSSNRNITEVAAPVHVIDQKEIERFENDGFINVINQYPGIRMEERSPGSYRLSIRGSSVRSPFGVRNVKVYWNNIPLTDADGITYFNQLDMNSFQGIEILRGPSASIYGAGIGGVILLDSKAGQTVENKGNSLKVNSLFGSFNTQNRSVTFTSASSKVNTLLNYSHAGTDGYRDYSQMRRDAFNFRSSFFLNDKHTIHLFSFYGDLNYQTPGGLNLEQKEENPRWARQATRFTPSSEEQKAAIYQKLFTFGVSQEFRISPKFKTEISLFGTRADLKNPFITNFEIREQRSVGIRNNNIWQLSDVLKMVAGLEFQQTNSSYDVFDNNGGVTGDQQFAEQIKANQSTYFAQFEASLPSDFFLTAGLSLNQQLYDYDREGGLKVNQNSGIPLMPRISVLKKIAPAISAFASVSGGYSPPTAQELVANFELQNSNISPLEAESGTNYEVGIKGRKLHFGYEVNGYFLKMNDAIIRNVTNEGRDFFSNAGESLQKGLEILGTFDLPVSADLTLVGQAGIDLKSYAYTNFSDRESIFDGNLIPSVPKQTYMLTADLKHNAGFYFNNNFTYLSEVPLDNANTVFADPFALLNSRLGFKKEFDRFTLDLFAGGNNLLNADYSLGNDINAFGSRYYNPSPTRNWNGGASFTLRF
ncbi:TonB-dependent receptor family protein [Jiulongibacter sediminis]|uniref:TonB-dependent receptor n=1 Tax=Jiulongibacter sediminis TaxID=1605367 RepID=A0A0P7BPC4_9BACT|nr:TonB-dependent receptor [Jiulongibacter sediminis]KPM47128.1 hypothetical protein AFM12_15000 [Jiulongibacter sediminis]TBX22689.1 hypothetical protein TK44_15010 [Jiulongibacter sediminis]